MVELSDFGDYKDQAASLADFSFEGNKTKVSNTPSNTNYAAHVAVLSRPEEVVSNYRTANAELSDMGSSTIGEQISNAVRERQFNAARDAFVSYATDPSVSGADKERAALGLLEANRKVNPLTNIISEEALVAGSANETREAEFVRTNSASVINSVNEHKKAIQSIINRETSKNDSGISDKVLSFAELMVPYVESVNLARIISDYKETGNSTDSASKAVVLMGEARNDIRNGLLKMPPEERLRAAEAYAEIVNNHKNILFSDDNDFARLTNIRSALEDGYYTNTDRFVDDITSLLDASVIGAPIAKTVSKAYRGLKVSSMAADASKMVKVPVEAPKGLTEASKAAPSPEDVQNWMKSGRPDGDLANTPIKSLENAQYTLPKELQGLSEVQVQEKLMQWLKDGRPNTDVSNIPIHDLIYGTQTYNETKAVRNSVRSDVSPVTVSQNYKDANPEKARAMHDIALNDKTEEVANAAYGTGRADAIANDLLPEVGNGAGGVRNKVGSIGLNKDLINSPNPEVLDFVNNDGAIYYTRNEKVMDRARVVNDFKNAVGLHTRDEMLHVEDIPEGVRISAVYGPKEGGFSNPQSALDLVEFALRDKGIRSEDVVLLKRTGEDYLPVSKGGQGEGDYLISVKHDYRFDPSQMENMDRLDVKRNMLDRIPPLTNQREGSLQQLIIDAASSLHPTIIKGANRAVDTSTGLEKVLSDLGRSFSKEYASLPKDRRANMFSFIKEANEQGLSYDRAMLKSRGFNENEISILHKNKEAWDNIFWLENRDLVKSLHNRGWKIFTDKVSDTEVVAKAVRKQDLPNTVLVYDTNYNIVREVNKTYLDELYEQGGTIAKLRTPIPDASEMAEYVISKEKPGASFLRTLNDDEQVLNYRNGYYQVHYKDPHFIVKVIKDSQGNVIREQAVASAGNMRDGNIIAKRMRENSGEEFYVRKDIKGQPTSEDSKWDLNVSIGRTAQKVRGKRLEDASSVITNPSHENILDPIESLTRSIRSVSNRVSMRDYLEATKARYMKQFGELLPSNGMGGKMFPDSVKDIGSRGGYSTKQVADARTTFNYVRTLEEGYVNSIDDFFKVGVNTVADIIGSKGGKVGAKVEEGLRAIGETAPSQLARGTAFKLYLALNPLRQNIVQAHQVVRLAAIAPDYVVSGRLGSDFVTLSAALRKMDLPKILRERNMSPKEVEEMVKEFKKSGLSYAADANNLVRQDLQRLADSTILQKIGTALDTPINYAQKIGFDAGENVNMMTAWLTFRNEAIKSGVKMNSEAYAEIGAKARNFTYNMNRAGDMPYNRNSLSAVFQFLQVPHKALLQDFTNRVLSVKERARVLAFDTVMWGVGSASVIAPVQYVLDQIEDPETRRAITNGLEELIINKVLSLTTGTKTAIDFSSSFSPTSLTNIFDTVGQIWTTDLGSMIASTPSGQLLAGGNPRITNAFKTAARYFNIIDDYQDPTTFSETATEFCKLASGCSNYFKAAYAMKYGEKISSLGKVMDGNVNSIEATAQLFGFKTMTEALNAKVTTEIYEGGAKGPKGSKLEQDVTLWYKELRRHLSNQDITRDQALAITRTYSEAWRVWGNGNPKALEIVNGLLQRDLNRNEDVMFSSISKTLEFKKPEETRRLVLDSGLPEDKKKILLDMVEFMTERKEK